MTDSANHNGTIKKIPNGSTITFMSNANANKYFLLGRTYKAVYIDEPRFVNDILDLIELLRPIIASESGYVSVFGTINEEFISLLEDIGFDLTRSIEVI